MLILQGGAKTVQRFISMSFLAGVKFEMLALSSKYGLNTVRNGKIMAEDATWTCFQHKVHF